MEQLVNMNFVSNSDQQLQLQMMKLELFMKINMYLLLKHASGLRDSEKDILNWTMIRESAVWNSTKSENSFKIF